MLALTGFDKEKVGYFCPFFPTPPLFLFIGGMKRAAGPLAGVAAALFFSCLFAQGRQIARCSGAAEGREENLKP